MSAPVVGVDALELAEETAARAARRHPAMVTRDRLVEHREAFADHLTPADLAAIVRAEAALRAIPGRIDAERALGGDGS